MVFRLPASLVNIAQNAEKIERDPVLRDRRSVSQIASHGQNWTDIFEAAVEDGFGGR
jgi:hypothetical protein